jgi:hypothetical protein
MDLLIVGPPGSLFRWVCDLVQAAASAQGVATATGYLGRDDAWPEQAAPQTADLRLLTANVPSAALLAAAGGEGLPTLIVVGQPAQSLAEMRHGGHELGVTLRHLSASTTPLGSLLERPSTMAVTPEAEQNQAEAARNILTFAGLGAMPDEAVPAFPAAADISTLTPVETELVDAILAPAFHYATVGERRMFVWPRCSLYWGDHPGEPVPRVIELTGPARVLVYGPYCHLPPGRWAARATLAFSQSCRGAPFALEVLSTKELGRVRFRVPQAGLFEVACSAYVPSSAEPLEMRLVTERGAIDGTLGIDRVEFRPEPDEVA